MRKNKKALATITALIYILSFIAIFQFSIAEAQNKTIVVPDHFSTISLALKNSTNGDTIYVKSGTYAEKGLRINKAISLIGEGAESTKLILDSDSHEVILYPQVPDLFHGRWYDRALMVNSDFFVLSGFTISTTGGDINITGNNNQIRDNMISASLTILGSNNKIIGNVLAENPTAKRVYDYNVGGSHCNFSSNRVNGGDVNFVGDYNVVSFNDIKGSFSAWCNSGFFYNNGFTERGEFRVQGNDSVICRNILDHYGSGLVLEGYGNIAILNNITYCRIGIAPSAGSTMYANFIGYNEWTINSRNSILNPDGNLSFLINNNFVDNHHYTVQTFGMPKSTDYFDNGVVGNYWNSYNGSDGNGDGIGDLPFYLDPTHLDRYPRMNPIIFSDVEEVFPDWLIMPTINIVSPESATYSTKNVSLNFVQNKQTSWTGYSLDGAENKTISGNLTLTDLPLGTHNITVYATDRFNNQGASQTINFTIEESKLRLSQLEIATISILIVSTILVSLLIYKRLRKSN